MFVSHIFSASLAQQVELRRRATWPERFRIVRFESRFLLLGVPPIVVLLVLDLVGVSLVDSIEAVILLEGLSLGFWCGLAAQRAGMGRGTIALASSIGLIVGLVILALQVVLQPGSLPDWGVA